MNSPSFLYLGNTKPEFDYPIALLLAAGRSPDKAM